MLDTTSGKFKNISLLRESFLTSGLTTCLLSDSKNYIWAGTSTDFGLNKINPQTRQIEHYVNVSWDSTSFRGGDINCIFERYDGTIWIGTSKGLAMLISGSKSFKYFGLKKGFIDQDIKAIQEDSKHNLWISHNSGLVKFNPESGDFNNYTWADGLQDNAFNSNSSVKLSDGRIAFGGKSGLNIFVPENINPNPYKPLPLIVSIKVNDEIRYLTDPNEPIKLKYSERNIEFVFSSSDYQNPIKNEFLFKLEGYDKDWIKESSNRSAKYTNLPSGNYLFVVKTSNNDGLWCEKNITVKIRIGYPLWLRWWSILFEFIVLVGIVALIVKLRVRKISLQKKVLVQEVESRTREITSKNEEISTQNELLQKQKDHIHHIHNQISDSIEYAQYLQNSYFLTREQRNTILGENFLIFLPKEKLSGDFLWAVSYDDSSIIALVDCIGHGVPGALMSMLGLTLLREVSISSLVNKPSEVLKKIHNRLIETLKDDKSEVTNLNTLDIGYCILNREKGELQFAGAHISLYISRFKGDKKIIEELRGDKKQPGNPFQDDDYKLHCVSVSKGDVIYMFTDGYVDQYNNITKEKFSRSRAKEHILKLNGLPLEIQREIILSGIYEWRGETDQTDDITVLGIKV